MRGGLCVYQIMIMSGVLVRSIECVSEKEKERERYLIVICE